MGDSNQNLDSFEREIKLRLENEESYQCLWKALPRYDSRVSQENQFYDTMDCALQKHKLACRIREESGKKTLTVKTGNTGKGAISIRNEWECSIENQEAEVFLKGPLPESVLNLVPMQKLQENLDVDIKTMSFQLTCQFSNLRRRIPVLIEGKEYQLELDETDFGNGHKRYELEVEFQNMQESKILIEYLKNLFLMNVLPWLPETVSKYACALSLQK